MKIVWNDKVEAEGESWGRGWKQFPFAVRVYLGLASNVIIVPCFLSCQLSRLSSKMDIIFVEKWRSFSLRGVDTFFFEFSHFTDH